MQPVLLAETMLNEHSLEEILKEASRVATHVAFTSLDKGTSNFISVADAEPEVKWDMTKKMNFEMRGRWS